MAHAPYCHLWPARLYSIFIHYLISGTILENKLLKTKCVFWFSLRILSETFPILIRIEQDMIKMYTGLHVKYPFFFSDFNETWIFSTIFRKILKFKISLKPVQWEPSLFHANITKLVVTFLNIANVPKKEYCPLLGSCVDGIVCMII
jgi:hypothetical protein